ncbi:hypothetical protein PVK06_002266 [Gossypium arboreum]|uniref:Uncharacterized protein n=1 Tax=Gossypium arboreum TaxID=29729 RepID=A0ABR0R340_GOSAR|nr:hypothetical protein PVK06_002266 [Gossypium arboreum]
MELEDDDDLGTMIAIYCPSKIENPSPVELFVEIANPEPIQVVILISQHFEYDFDLNVYWEYQSGYGGSLQTPKNSNYGRCSYNIPISCPCLEIYPEVLGAIANGDEGFDNEDQSHQDNEDFSDPNLNEIPEDRR